MMSIEAIIASLSYLGIFLLMITNGIFSTPSSQILYIISGYFVSTGVLNFWFVLICGAIGNTIGNVLLYEATKKKGLHYVMKFNLLSERDVKKTEIAFKKKGALFILIGKLLPTIKVIVPIVAAIGKLKRKTFIALMFLGSLIWASAFMGIGFIFGKSTKVFTIYAPIILLISVVVVWIFYRYINSKEILDELEK